MNDNLRDRLKDIIRELEDILDETDETTEGDASDEPGQPAISKKMAIVVGHTNKRPGAIAVAPISEHEYSWNKDLAKQIKDHSDSIGVPLKIFFRDNVGISGAYRQAENYGASAVMELHFNSFNSPSATGTETLWSTSLSKSFAENVQQAMVGVLGLRDRKIKHITSGRGHNSLTQLSETPSILIEPFFGSNPNDAATAHECKNKLARALVEATKKFFAGRKNS